MVIKVRRSPIAIVTVMELPNCDASSRKSLSDEVDVVEVVLMIQGRYSTWISLK